MIRTYSELIELDTFEERLEYLKLNGVVGEGTFGFDRYLNQRFYHSDEWKSIRHKIIVRDKACDLAIPELELDRHIIIHHMNPLRSNDILEVSEYLKNPEYLICVSQRTHNAIHYGTEVNNAFVERRSGDTKLW